MADEGKKTDTSAKDGDNRNFKAGIAVGTVCGVVLIAGAVVSLIADEVPFVTFTETADEAFEFPAASNA